MKNTYKQFISNFSKLLFVLVVIFSSSCNLFTSDAERRAADSTEILQVIIGAYQWNADTDATSAIEFPLEVKNDTILGIDKQAFDQDLDSLKKVPVFSTEFFARYKTAAYKIDSCFRNDKEKYSSKDIPPYGPFDGDLFCDCQDGPEDIIGSMQFDSLKIENDHAYIVWTWKGWDNAPYYIKLQKENEHWKISQLQGLDELPYIN